MARVVDLGEAVTDHFPVWEPDGVTKKSGETSFTVQIWRDGAAVALAYSLTEIGSSGEYKIKFTPLVAGIYSVEVIAAYSGDVFGAEYDVRKPELVFNFAAADDHTNATFAVWAEQRGERVTALDSVAAVVREADGTEVVDLGTDAADTGDGVFEFSTASSNIAAGAEYYLDVTATRSGVSWYANLGFSKV
jgi:hypothetical protein